MVAALVFTYIVNSQSGNALGETMSLRLLSWSVRSSGSSPATAGALLGSDASGYLVYLIALAFVLLAFAVSNLFAAESGLLATTIMGIIIANANIPNFRTILSFKEDLTVLVISVLFIVLAANIELSTLLQVTNWSSFVLLLVIMLVIRPATIFLSTIGTSFTLQEKLYLSWIAPRGVVMTSVSALFAARLTGRHRRGRGARAARVPGHRRYGAAQQPDALPLARRLGVAGLNPRGS